MSKVIVAVQAIGCVLNGLASGIFILAFLALAEDPWTQAEAEVACMIQYSTVNHRCGLSIRGSPAK